jgi:hypothetical protein
MEAGNRVVCDLCFAFVTFPHPDTFGTSDFNPLTERKRGEERSPPFSSAAPSVGGERCCDVGKLQYGKGRRGVNRVNRVRVLIAFGLSLR